MIEYMLVMGKKIVPYKLLYKKCYICYFDAEIFLNFFFSSERRYGNCVWEIYYQQTEKIWGFVFNCDLWFPRWSLV